MWVIGVLAPFVSSFVLAGVGHWRSHDDHSLTVQAMLFGLCWGLGVFAAAWIGSDRRWPRAAPLRYYSAFWRAGLVFLLFLILAPSGMT